MGFEWRLLKAVHDDKNFKLTIRNVMLFGIAIAFGSEVLGVFFPVEIPPDMMGSLIMSVVFGTTAVLCQLDAKRAHVALALVAVCGVAGWYHARTGRSDIAALLANQGAIFLLIGGAQALLQLSVVEFLVSVSIYLLSLAISLNYFSPGLGAELTLVAFYASAAITIGCFGILSRTRLQEAEIRARGELSELNAKLEVKVEQQIKKIRRSEVLQRFLPPQVSSQLMKDGGAPAIGHIRRQVAIVSAAPTGFLEALARMDGDEAASRVNEYVASMSQLAFDLGGVVERVVGPRMTVIFGAMAETAPEDAMGQALNASLALQKEATALVARWEAGGADNARLRLAVGVSHGEAILGTFGSERRVDYSALGGVMVRAVRLSAEAIPGEVRIDEKAALHVPTDFEVVGCEAIEFSPGEPVPCYVAVSRVAQRHLPSDPPRSGDGPETLEALKSTRGAVDFDSGLTMKASDPVEDSAPVRSRRSRPSLSLGDSFDERYRLETLVGKGGMATVYRARHVALGQVRALKIISPKRLDSPAAVEQFRREAEATARIHHPNVVRLHDFGRSLEGQYYLVLDYVDGDSLAQLLDVEHVLPLRRALELGLDILKGLAAAHLRELVHQDLKPSNVMLQGDSALVTDFGLVTFSGNQTSEASLGGTPAYMSPEQWMNQPLDARSDLYAWGVIMYEMLCGDLPLHGASLHEFAAVAVYREPDFIGDLVHGVPRPLAQLIHQCLAKTPEERPDSAEAVAAQVTEFLESAASARADSERLAQARRASPRGEGADSPSQHLAGPLRQTVKRSPAAKRERRGETLDAEDLAVAKPEASRDSGAEREARQPTTEKLGSGPPPDKGPVSSGTKTTARTGTPKLD